LNILLLDELPSKVLIGGLEVSINTGFKTSITFENLMNEYDLDNEEDKKEFWDKALKLYYPILNIDFDKADMQDKLLLNHVADNISEAINQMMWFYRCGEELKQEKSQESKKGPSYSYEHDGDKIFSAFKDQYNVNLIEDNIHWWEFKAMFGSLKEDNEICKIIGIRATDLSRIQDKNLKEHYRKLQTLLAIPKSDEEVEANKKFAELMKNGGELSQLED
jgi:hypothetical protein